jgi:hypothetical protein
MSKNIFFNSSFLAWFLHEISEFFVELHLYIFMYIQWIIMNIFIFFYTKWIIEYTPIWYRNVDISTFLKFINE